jgi:hypothetical protein
MVKGYGTKKATFGSHLKLQWYDRYFCICIPTSPNFSSMTRCKVVQAANSLEK